MSKTKAVKEKRLVFGVGINDADYVTRKCKYFGYTGLKQNMKVVWTCPFYTRWKNMLKRCYYYKYQERQPTYNGCYVCEDWLTFSIFRKWMVEQEWEGMQLEKDILFSGNKAYSPDTCVFVSAQVNNFITDRSKDRGEWPIGVTLEKSTGKFQANCSNPFTGKGEYLGVFNCPLEAHLAWLSKKLEHAYALAAIQKDPRVAEALIDRYENYTISTGDYYE